MKVRDILQSKGRHVYTIEHRQTLAEVVDRLVEHNCGSLVVKDRDRVVGIITERDILRANCSNRESFQATAVRDKMTSRLITGNPDDDVSAVMGLLTSRRIRHLPIMEDGQLVGMVSIGDVVKAQHDSVCQENHFLKSYIYS
ncbi:MAG: CBS domain-containing protein [Planctomycetales bacterium]|nr:CBS domain-containing protein [Planctomycetales bacterium]